MPPDASDVDGRVHALQGEPEPLWRQELDGRHVDASLCEMFLAIEPEGSWTPQTWKDYHAMQRNAFIVGCMRRIQADPWIQAT